MKLPELRLIHTTAVRLAIKSVLLYGLLLSLVLAALYWVSSDPIDKRLESELEQELFNLQLLNDLSGSHQLIEQINHRKQQKNNIYILVSANGEKLAGNLLDWPEDVNIKLDGRTQNIWVNDEVIPKTIHNDDAYWPIVATQFNDGSKLLLARSIEQATSLQELSEFLIEAMGIAIVFAALISIILGRQILRRMDAISATASDIMGGDLSQRIPVSNKQDEFDTLAGRLNAMLDRVQQLIRNSRCHRQHRP